jgi:heme-degrading monooxygenase HmoA
MTDLNLPEPPYYAVIFINQRTDIDQSGYETSADRMVELAAQQEGYLGIESVRDTSGKGITVSYWQSEDAIQAWKNNIEHTAAREDGYDKWYENYQLQVAKVERGYRWIRS